MNEWNEKKLKQNKTEKQLIINCFDSHTCKNELNNKVQCFCHVSWRVFCIVKFMFFLLLLLFSIQLIVSSLKMGKFQCNLKWVCINYLQRFSTDRQSLTLYCRVSSSPTKNNYTLANLLAIIIIKSMQIQLLLLSLLCSHHRLIQCMLYYASS